MKHFEFVTTCTMKEYNNRKWWIDPGYIRSVSICAENLKTALEQFRETIQNRYFVSISDNAIKNKQPMYIDTKTGESKQIGYVITGKTEFCDEQNCKWVNQYIELWVTIKTHIDTDFSED